MDDEEASDEASLDQTADTDSQDIIMDEDVPVEVNGVVHAK